MIQRGRDKIVEIALNKIKEKIVDPEIDGIGVVKEIRYKDGKALLTIALEGLEDRPITVEASDIVIAQDGSSITINTFNSNMPFAKKGLTRFLAGKSLPIPEENRSSVVMAKKLLNIG